MPADNPEVIHSWHLFAVRIRPGTLRVGTRQVIEALRQEGIGVQVHYVPLHLHPHVQRYARVPQAGLPVAEQAFKSLISLPLWPGMTDEDAGDVVEALYRLIAFYRR